MKIGYQVDTKEYGSRHTGRQKVRSRDEITKILDMTWIRKAQERERERGVNLERPSPCSGFMMAYDDDDDDHDHHRHDHDDHDHNY